MTDERIKEEFEKSRTPNTEAFGFSLQYEAGNPAAVAFGFYSGSRIAERLDKIEVLEEVKAKVAGLWFDLPNRAIAEIDSMLSDLKGEQ